MYVEQYLPLLERDIQQITTNIDQPMPEPVRYALEAELRKLEAMRSVLMGGDEKKSVLHSLRANLRYTRKRAREEKDHKKKLELEKEIRRLEFEIAKGVQQSESKS